MYVEIANVSHAPKMLVSLRTIRSFERPALCAGYNYNVHPAAAGWTQNLTLKDCCLSPIASLLDKQGASSIFDAGYLIILAYSTCKQPKRNPKHQTPLLEGPKVVVVRAYENQK